MKRKILICVLMGTLLFNVSGCGSKTKENKKEEIKESKIVTITSKDVVKDQNLDGLKITNVSMTIDEGITSYNAKVTNETDTDIEIEKININVKDKDGNTIADLIGYVGGIVKSKETKDIVNTIDTDLSNAFEVTYSK